MYRSERRTFRATLLAVPLLALWPSSARAEWQIKPFVGVTFAGATTFVNLEQAAGEAHRTWGVTGGLLGEVFGVEGEFGYSPGFFGERDLLIVKSSVTSISANLIVALPQRWTEYTLRPYLVGGGGVMRVSADDSFNVLTIKETHPAWNAGAGLTGFLTDTVGVNWELRYFRNISNDRSGVSFGREQVSFFRATMALAIRLDRRTR